MLFSYVDFPKLPDAFIEPCMEMIPLIETSPLLKKINELEGDALRIAYIHPRVQKWLYENIIFKHFTYFTPGLMLPFLHVSKHLPYLSLGPESHPMHTDYGRKYAFNYFIDQGGDDVWTNWYDNTTDKNIIESHKIEPFRWHVIAVNPELHGVDGIDPDRYRISISLNWDPPVPKTLFNARDYFKDILLDK
jgi:hypothetical protein